MDAWCLLRVECSKDSSTGDALLVPCTTFDALVQVFTPCSIVPNTHIDRKAHYVASVAQAQVGRLPLPLAQNSSQIYHRVCPVIKAPRLGLMEWPAQETAFSNAAR